MAAREHRTGLRRVFRFVRRTLLSLIVFALVASVVVLIAIHTGWGRGLIKDEVEASLNSAFPGGATVEALEGSVLGDFTLKNVTINDLDGKPAITVGTLRANAALGKLMRKTAELEKLELEDVSIRLGTAPLTKPSEDPDSEPTGWSVQLPSIDVKRGTFEFFGPDPKAPAVAIDGIAITGALAIPAGAGISATKLDVAGRWRQRDLPVVITGGVELDDGIAIPDARIKVGDLSLTATGLVIDTQQPTGTIKIIGSPEAIAAVLPEVEMPAGIDLEITTKPSGRAADLALTGTIGKATLHGSFHADLERKSVSGFLGAGGLNVRRLLRSTAARPPVRVRGDLALAVTVDRKGVRGIAGVRGAARDLPEADATIVIDATWRDAGLIVLATGAGDSRIAAAAHATRDGEKLTLDRGRVVASSKNLALPTNELVKVSGRELFVDVRLDKPAPLTPALDLDFSGIVRGARVVADAIVLAAVDTTFEGTLRDKLLVQSTTSVRGASRAGLALGSATINANLLADGRIYSRVDARPAAAAVGVEANGYITLGDVVKVALGTHEIKPVSGVPWTGKGGTITIDRLTDTIKVREIVTSSAAGGRAKVEVTLTGATAEASVDAQGLPAVMIDPTYRGTLSGKLAVTKRGVRWDGGGDLVAAGVVIDPAIPVFDGDVHLALAGRRVTVDAKANSATMGSARLELDVEGPRDITDVVAWRRLERTAIQSALITVDKVALDAVSSTGGLIEGKVKIGGTEVEGAIEVLNVSTPLGTAEGTVSFSPIGKDLFASWNALLSDVGEANIGLRITFPQYPFDPASWKQLGRGIVQSLTASFDDLQIDPAKLAKLGINAPYGGRADIRLAVGAAATAATLDVDLREIEGGELRKPIDIHFEATTDGQGTTASACVARAKDPGGDACARGGLAAVASVARLFEVTDVKLPVTFSTWITAPKTALGVALSGKIAIPSQSATEYFALVGRQDFDPKRGSTIDGAIQVDGTLGRPTADGTFTLKKLQLLSNITGRSIPELAELKIEAGWDGTTGKVTLTADEVSRDKQKHQLKVFATARPDKLEEGTGTFTAIQFDLAPLAVFLPGELAASQGILDSRPRKGRQGGIEVNGFDLATSKIRGDLDVTQGHIPLHPIIGSLRNAKMRVDMTDKGYKLTATGLLNSCQDPKKPNCTENVTLEAFSPPTVDKLDATLIATKVSTIGEIEPIIDGTAKVALRRTGRLWTGDIFLRGGRVFVPESTGDDLLDFEAPDDVYFTDRPAPKQIRLGGARVPTTAWLDARLHIETTTIEVEEYGANAAVASRQPLQLRIGDAIGLDGKIWVIYGDAKNLFGRRYDIEQNDIVSFDGTIDPTINLQMSTALRDLRLTVRVTGALSDPGFPGPDSVEFTADPAGQWNRDQLFGFFLGGEPGGNVQDAVGKVGASVASQFILKKLGGVLPEKLRIDVFACEPGSSTTGGSCTIGRRLSDGKIYVAFKHRMTAQPNENQEEALIQYYFSTEWFVEGTGGSSNIDGVDLLWRRRW